MKVLEFWNSDMSRGFVSELYAFRRRYAMTAPAPWAVQGADRTRQPSSAMSVIPD